MLDAAEIDLSPLPRANTSACEFPGTAGKLGHHWGQNGLVGHSFIFSNTFSGFDSNLRADLRCDTSQVVASVVVGPCKLANMQATPDRVLEEMTRRIVDGFQPEKVVLFGSRARGDSRPDSDYDLLVVLKTCPSRRRMAVDLRSELADVLAGKDILVADSAEVEADSSHCPIIVRSALREGQILYERR